MLDVNSFPRILLNVFAPSLLWYLLIDSPNDSLPNSYYLLISFGIFFHLHMYYFAKEYDNLLIHFNYRLKHLCLSYSFVFLLVLTILFFTNSYQELIIKSLNISLLLFFILVIGNELISRNQKRKIEAIIVGSKYKLTVNDFMLLNNMNIEYTLYNDFKSLDGMKTGSAIIINNTYDNFEKNSNQNHSMINMNKFLETYLRKIPIDHLSQSGLDSMKYNFSQFLLKRLIDFIVIIFFIPICMVIIPLSYIVVKSQSIGRFIFLQDRIGKHGKTFKIIKIRSMHYAKESNDKTENEDQLRIFPYGSFMRKTRIDEMPQFVNVLIGDMHISGPRAEWLDLHHNYLKKIKNYHLRQNVAPGITGFAQVMFRYGHNEEDTIEKLMFDLYYIKNWSFWLEFEIGLRTVMIMFAKKGT